MPAHKTKVVVVVVALAEKDLTLVLQLRPLMLLNMPQFLATVVRDLHLASAVPHVGMQVVVVEPLGQVLHCQMVQVVWAAQAVAVMVEKLQNWVK
jgi:hypothetical protein